VKVAGKAPVVVVGTIFVDLKCFPKYELNFKGRNPGVARFFHGGVGRNVAETMALLGSHVRFSSAAQEGGLGHEVLTRLNDAGVDVDGVYTTASPEANGMWVAILNREGDLACSVSQMPNVVYLEQAWERHGERMLRGSCLTVLELDLSVKLADRVLTDAARHGVPVVGLPGNFECVRHQPDLLPRLHTFVCNQVEAEELCGQRPISSVPAAKQAARLILARGLKAVVVTLGPLGAVGFGQGMDEPFFVPAQQVEVVDTTGAGDAFVAGFSHSLAAGAGLRLAVEAGTRVAAWTVSATESVCRDLRGRMDADSWEGWGEIDLARKQSSFDI